MPSLTQTIEVSAAPEEAWGVLTDLSRYSEWLTIHDSWPNGEPTLEPGTHYVQKLKIMGMPADVNWSVNTIEEPAKLHLEGAGPMGAKLETIWTVEASGEGSEIGYTAEFSGGGLEGPMGEMVTKQAGTEAEKSLENLKGILG